MNGFVCLAKPPGKTWYWPARAFPSWETAIAARTHTQPLPQPVPVPTVPKGHVVIAFLEAVEFPAVLVLPQADVTSYVFASLSSHAFLPCVLFLTHAPIRVHLSAFLTE